MAMSSGAGTRPFTAPRGNATFHGIQADHRGMLREVMERFALGDALDKKLSESDRRSERLERRRRQADRGEHDVASSSGDDAPLCASCAPLSPTGLRDLYKAQRSTMVGAPRNMTATSQETKPSRYHPMASHVSHEQCACNDSTTCLSHSSYRTNCFPIHSLSPNSRHSVPPRSAEELCLRDGELCVASLCRLQARVEASACIPADYATTRARIFDAQRRAALKQTIQQGDELIHKMLSMDGTGAGAADSRRAVGICLAVPPLRSPKPVRVPPPRLQHDALDAYTSDDAKAHWERRVLEKKLSRRYHDTATLDATLLRTTMLGSQDLTETSRKHLSDTTAALACQRLNHHQRRMKLDGGRDAVTPSSRHVIDWRQQHSRADANHLVIAGTFPLEGSQ
jgi:hypothetical protein